MIRPALMAARLHARPVCRPGSVVFHLSASPLTPSGRWVSRAGRTVCNQSAGRLSVLVREGAVVALEGRRLCRRCSARLASLGRDEQPPVNADAAIVYWRAVELRDLVTAIVLCASVDESHAVGRVLRLVFPPASARRPAEPTRAQALYDIHRELDRSRRHLRVVEMTPEQREAAARVREDEAAERARVEEARRKGAALDRAIDRRNAGRYLRPHERDLVDTA